MEPTILPLDEPVPYCWHVHDHGYNILQPGDYDRNPLFFVLELSFSLTYQSKPIPSAKTAVPKLPFGITKQTQHVTYIA